MNGYDGAKYGARRIALAWTVHVFTASGLLAGFLSVLAIGRGDWRAAMLWLLAALTIDGIDGTLARLVRVEQVLPRVSGKAIDDLVDFLNYAFIPAYLFYQAELVAGPWGLALAFLILLVSALYYGRDGMVSDDMFFVGFPVAWNMLLFFLIFVFRWPAWANAAVVVLAAVLHFVPLKFVYPSRARRWRVPTLLVAGAGMLLAPAVIYLYPQRLPVLNAGVIGVGVYLLGFAVWETWVVPRRTGRSRPGASTPAA